MYHSFSDGTFWNFSLGGYYFKIARGPPRQMSFPKPGLGGQHSVPHMLVKHKELFMYQFCSHRRAQSGATIWTSILKYVSTSFFTSSTFIEIAWGLATFTGPRIYMSFCDIIFTRWPLHTPRRHSYFFICLAQAFELFRI